MFQATIAKISKARTVVRQMKTLGKAKKLAKAEARLAKLKAKEVQTVVTRAEGRGLQWRWLMAVTVMVAMVDGDGWWQWRWLMTVTVRVAMVDGDG